MINWVSSEDEHNVKKINLNNWIKNMNFSKKQNCNNEMINYVKEIYNESIELLSATPSLVKDNLSKEYKDNFIIDGSLKKSNVIISSSDINSYYTIKELNKNKEDLTVVCFDMHSDTYDYNDSLWKGNGFSLLMKEGYVNHYIVNIVYVHGEKECLE